MVDIWWMLILHGKYVSLLAFLRTYAIFAGILFVIAVAIAIVITFH